MWQGLLNKIFKAREKFAINLSKDDEEKPFLEHLEDLRTMIVRMVLTIIISVIGTFIFHKQLFYIIKLPLLNAEIVKTMEETVNYLRSNGPAETFMAMVNLSLIAAVIISFPLLMLFILQFILPGLKDNEKKLVFPAIAVGAGLFLTGVLFAYFVVLPKALFFFEEFGRSMGVRQDWTLGDYITFTTRFVLVFGIAFELPVIVMALVKLDILNYKLMKSTWKHAIIGITVFAAIITPTPDVITLMLMSGPLYVLYAICVWLAYFMEKKDRAMYPEYYAQIEKDAAELEKESATDEWDKDDYNPWSTADDEDEDDDEGYRKKSETPKPSPEPESNADKPETPAKEKTLEEYSEDDQARNSGG
jgi:Tat protein translocase TatC